MEDKKKKLLEIYAKASEPKEMFFDLFEKTEKMQKSFDDKFEEVKNLITEIPEDKTDDILAEIERVEKLIPEIDYDPILEEIEKIRKEIPEIPDIPKQYSAEKIRDLISSLKKDDRLSVFSLKDTEWLKGAKDVWVQGNIVSGGGIQNITGFIEPGTNITITGSGTLADPYVINSSGGGGEVTSVSNSDGTLIISPTTGDVVASLNPAALSGYVPYTGAKNNVDLGVNTITATEFLSGDSSVYTPPAPPVSFMVNTLSNTSVSEILGNLDPSPNASSDRVWINDATDAAFTQNYVDEGFNSSTGDVSHQTFLYDFPAPSTCEFDTSFTDIYSPANGLNLNQVIQFDGTLPPEFSLLTNYYVVLITDADHFQVSDTYMGSPITPSTTETGVNWAIFGADLAGGYTLGTDPVQMLNMYTDGGDTVYATFTLSSVQVTWTTGLTAAATADVTGDFPFTALTGFNTSYKYNTDGRQAWINGSNENHTWYINGYSTANQVWDIGLTQAKLYNTVLSDTNLTKSFGATFDGAGGVISGTNYIAIKFPYNAIINNWYIHSYRPDTGVDLAGNIQIDVKYGGTSIIGAGNPPKLGGTATNTATITHWNRPKIRAGDELLIYVNGAVATCQKVTVTFNATLN